MSTAPVEIKLRPPQCISVDVSLTALVVYGYEPGVPCAIFDHGLPLEPDSPPDVEILLVDVNGVNITGALTREQLDSIARDVIEHHVEQS